LKKKKKAADYNATPSNISESTFYPNLFLLTSTRYNFFFATCRQCGKEFKPQELHSHMQSCRAFKERMKSSAKERMKSSASTRLSVDRSRAFSVEGRSKPRQEHPRPASAVFLLTGS
jgi:acetyl-CoA carboxylase beta subunit